MVLDPLLLNVMYNRVYVECKEATIFGFADDLAVVVSTKHLEDVEVYAMETVRAVKSWLERSGLRW